MATKGPLDGIKVLDLSWILSGPFATMTLSDLGATVVKVERPPYGDLGRTTRPIIDGESGYFFSVNRGKKSISIPLGQVKITRNVKSLIVYFRSCAKVHLWNQNKQRI